MIRLAWSTLRIPVSVPMPSSQIVKQFILYRYKHRVEKNQQEIFSSLINNRKGWNQLIEKKIFIKNKLLQSKPTIIYSFFPTFSTSSLISSPSPSSYSNHLTETKPNDENSPSSKNSTESIPSISHSKYRTLRLALLGNLTIAAFKLGAYLMTSSAAIFAEFIHTLVDSCNQALLIVGARESMRIPDDKHQFGYGKAAYFWSLVCALNIMWVGGIYNAYHTIIYASTDISHNWATWICLAVSFLIDGSVLIIALKELNRSKPKNKSLYSHIKSQRNPLLLAVILEDTAAVLGVMIAATGIILSTITKNLTFDHAASLSISLLLLYTSYRLIKSNYSYLLGFSLNPTTQESISELIRNRPSVSHLQRVRGEWLGSETFAYHAEVDFNGHYFSHLIENEYLNLFITNNDEQIIKILMERFAEDITRLVEEEIAAIEREIRRLYPAAAYIELEPGGGGWSSYTETLNKLKQSNTDNQTENQTEKKKKEFIEWMNDKQKVKEEERKGKVPVPIGQEKDGSYRGSGSIDNHNN